MRCSTRCTAASARTARSRACSTAWASPTPIPACAPRRWRWTRRRRNRCSPRRAAGRARQAGADRGTRGRRSAARFPTWSSRRTRAPRSAWKSCASAATGAPRSRATWRFGDQALVEEYVPGRELTVGVLDDRALTVTEIIAAAGFYDYEAKYADGGSRHVRAGAGASARSLRQRARSRAGGAPGARLPRRHARRLPLRRHRGRAGAAGAAGGQHAAGADADLAAARAGGASADELPALCAWMVEHAACRA